MSDAAFRLPTHIQPEHYSVRLSVHLDTWTFTGQEEIDLTLTQPESVLELHAVELQLSEASVETDAGEQPLSVTPNPERQAITLEAQNELQAGSAKLRLAFSGPVGTELRGLYRAQVDEDRYAFTQFEPTDARRVFPCFDEPSFKARFTLSVDAPADLTVISNEPIAEQSAGEGPGRQLVRFHTTPRMSTYLVALAVGKMEAAPAATTASGVPVQVWTVPGKTDMADFATEAGVASLDRLEAYFGIRYPYRKLDLLAVPDFEAGAMENSGAVFFRERRLLCKRDETPLETLKSIALVIAHELAHQWFGNLVTMEWWDDLWLNEAFASWMEHVIIHQWKPEWGVWIDFQQGKAAPFHRDAMVSTRSIHAPVANAEQASEMFDAITYEKGAAVLRMIEQYLSPEVFREGVRRYLQDHVEGNATAAHLFDALSEVSEQPIRQVATDWISQPGYPIVTISSAYRVSGPEPSPEVRVPSSEFRVRLLQARFYLNPAHQEQTHPEAGTSRAGREDAYAERGMRNSEQIWHVPVVLKYAAAGEVRERRVLLDSPEQDVSLEVASAGSQPPVDGPSASGDLDWLIGNAGENGFYRVRYDGALATRLAAHLPDALAPAERVGFLGNQWALTRAGHLTAGAFLDLLRVFAADPCRAVVDTVVDRLGFYRLFLVQTAHQARFSTLVDTLYRPLFVELGWESRDGEDDDTRLRRAASIRALGRTARSQDVVARARDRLEQHWSRPGSVDANLLDVLVAINAPAGDADLFERYLERSRADVPPDEQYRHLIGLGMFEEPRLVQQALGLTLTETIRTQDVGFLLVTLLSNSEAKEVAWQFVQAQWDQLVRRLPPLMMRRVMQATANLATAQARWEVERFYTEHRVEAAERTFRQTLEELDLLVAFRERAIPELDAYWTA